LIFSQLINQQKKIIGKVLLYVFINQMLFTGKDVVEISCHDKYDMEATLLLYLIGIDKEQIVFRDVCVPVKRKAKE